ncbi:hypothetical protein [Rubidibacter lacunae]|nr:hypothetical protein [Rubidibacter lacunae]
MSSVVAGLQFPNCNRRFASRDRTKFVGLTQNFNLPDPKKMMEAFPAN